MKWILIKEKQRKWKINKICSGGIRRHVHKRGGGGLRPPSALLRKAYFVDSLILLLNEIIHVLPSFFFPFFSFLFVFHWVFISFYIFQCLCSYFHQWNVFSSPLRSLQRQQTKHFVCCWRNFWLKLKSIKKSYLAPNRFLTWGKKISTRAFIIRDQIWFILRRVMSISVRK